MNSTAFVLVVFALLFSKPALALTDSDRSEYIPATRKDPLYEASLLMGLYRALPCMLDDEPMTIDRGMSIQEQNKLRHKTIKNISIRNGADEHLFDTPKLFPHLEHVSLGATTFNTSYLKALALNYPRLGGLYVRQSQPLSPEAISSLTSFQYLKELEIACPLSAPNRLTDLVPTNLKELWIAGCWKLPKLPKLEELWVTNCVVDSQFLKDLQAPHIRRLAFSATTFECGSLEGISRLGTEGT